MSVGPGIDRVDGDARGRQARRRASSVACCSAPFETGVRRPRAAIGRQVLPGGHAAPRVRPRVSRHGALRTRARAAARRGRSRAGTPSISARQSVPRAHRARCARGSRRGCPAIRSRPRRPRRTPSGDSASAKSASMNGTPSSAAIASVPPGSAPQRCVASCGVQPWMNTAAAGIEQPSCDRVADAAHDG